MVMLRGPVRRLVSFAKFRNVSLADFPAWAQSRAFNQATLMVNGVTGVGPKGYTGTLDVRSLCTEETTAAAIESISSNFTAVGTTELFSQSAFLLMRAFGWPQHTVIAALAVPNVPSDNGLTYEASDVDGETIARLNAIEKCDNELHSAAELIVTNRMVHMPTELEAKWHEFHAELDGGSTRELRAA